MVQEKRIVPYVGYDPEEAQPRRFHRSRIIALSKLPLSPKQIADWIGCHASTVYEALSLEYGKLPPHGYASDAEILALHRAGFSQREIGRRLKCGYRRIKRVITSRPTTEL